jgi:hypothetical protein
MRERIADFDPSSLDENEEFLSVVAFGVDAARRTHREEKREALRNAALNTAAGLKLNDIWLGGFLACIEKYTGAHIAILRILANPPANDVYRRYADGVHLAGYIEKGLERALPDLGEQEIHFIARELGGDGFADTPLTTMMSGEGVLAKRTTAKGDAFLKFIAEPT